MIEVLEKNVAKVVETISTDDLEKMTRPMRLTDLLREGREAGIEKSAGSWSTDDKMCFLATAVTSAKARGIL
jgi:hypothetical protein